MEFASATTLPRTPPDTRASGSFQAKALRRIVGLDRPWAPCSRPGETGGGQGDVSLFTRTACLAFLLSFPLTNFSGLPRPGWHFCPLFSNAMGTKHLQANFLRVTIFQPAP